MVKCKMIESRGILFIRFDGGRIGWFIADMHGVFCIWTAKLVLELAVLLTVYGVARITPIELSLMIHAYLGTWMSTELIVMLGIFWPLIIAFVYVFMLRRNPTVKLAQRALPYTRYNWI